MFVSVDGKSQEVTEIFAGGQDGKAHRITEMFGSVNGIAKQIYTVEKSTNAFDKFTWEEIKQLANEGKLLEHFKLYDKVVVKLKQPLTKTLSFYMTGYGKRVEVPQAQNEMLLEIIELTETKMRLVSPRVCALGTANSAIVDDTNGLSQDNKWYYFAQRFEEGSTSVTNIISDAWGMTEMYDSLKTIENALPDDLRDVLSVCTRPLISYKPHAITGAIQEKYDEDMRVRQLTTNVMKKTIDMTNDDVFYPVINESYFPTTVADYMYYIRLPEEYDTYEQRKYLVANNFRGFKLMNLGFKKTYNGSYIYYVTQAQCFSPYTSCYFTRGITTNDEYTTYNNSGNISDKMIQSTTSSTANCIFPEMIIEGN